VPLYRELAVECWIGDGLHVVLKTVRNSGVVESLHSVSLQCADPLWPWDALLDPVLAPLLEGSLLGCGGCAGASKVARSRRDGNFVHVL